MRQNRGPLTSGFVRTVETPGRYGDGRGGYGLSLLVRVTRTGYLSRSWQQRLYVDRKPVMTGLGNTRQLTLTEARSKAKRNADAVSRGKPTPRKWAMLKPAFAQVAEDFLALHSPGWRNSDKTARDWRTSLETYAYPVFGSLPVDRIKSAHVLDAVEAHWHTKNPTMQDVLQRCAAIIDLAIVKGHIEHNPVEAVRAALPKNVHTVEHRKAIAHADVGATLRTIRDGKGHIDAKQCLEFVIFTAVRSGEARGATWDEIDLDAATWTIPGSRTKGKEDHRVALNDAAIDVLMQARERHGDSGLVFRAVRGGEMADKRIGDIMRFNEIPGTVHGFRTSFRTWAQEESNAEWDEGESALGHRVGNSVQRAYARSDQFAARRVLMQEWANYITG